MDRQTLEQLREIAGLASRPIQKLVTKVQELQKHLEGQHDQSTHGNRGGMSRAEGEPGRIDPAHGMGGFLNPPDHPEHTHHVEVDLSRRPENRGGMSLSAAAETEWLHPRVREEARRLLDEWDRTKLPLDHPDVKDWTHQVLGYFRGMYTDPDKGHSRNVSDLTHDPNADPIENADRHAGVLHIREYYPDYKPTGEDFDNAYWGRKPEKVVKHGDHDQSTHGHRDGAVQSEEKPGGGSSDYDEAVGIANRAARYRAVGETEAGEKDKQTILDMARRAAQETGYTVRREYHEGAPGEHYRFTHPETGRDVSVWYGDRAGLEMLDMAEAIKEMRQPHKAVESGGLSKVLRHEGSKWVLYSEDGSKKLGEYDAREDAQRRLRQIEYFKHHEKVVGSGDLTKHPGHEDQSVHDPTRGGARPTEPSHRDVLERIHELHGKAGGKHGIPTNAAPIYDHWDKVLSLLQTGHLEFTPQLGRLGAGYVKLTDKGRQALGKSSESGDLSKGIRQARLVDSLRSLVGHLQRMNEQGHFEP